MGGRRQTAEQSQALARIVELLAAFRDSSMPIFHIAMKSRPGSSFFSNGTGYPVKDEAREIEGEPVIVKRVNSAFIGTDLEKQLRAADIKTLVICGATTNHCVETTTRMAGNLGFDARLVRDATWTFDRVGPDGDAHAAADNPRHDAGKSQWEFARIVSASETIAALKLRVTAPRTGSCREGSRTDVAPAAARPPARHDHPGWDATSSGLVRMSVMSTKVLASPSGIEATTIAADVDPITVFVERSSIVSARSLYPKSHPCTLIHVPSVGAVSIAFPFAHFTFSAEPPIRLTIHLQIVL